MRLSDKPFEGDVLVGEGVDGDLARSSQELPEGGVSGDIGAKDQDVDECTDQRLHLDAGASGVENTDDKIILTGVALEESEKRGCEDHEQRGSLSASHLQESCHQLGLKKNAGRCAAMGLRRCTRDSGREVERGQRTCQLQAPVVKLPGKFLALFLLPLPDGEVGVLDREVGQGRDLTLAVCVVQRVHLALHDPRRPEVGGDVMMDFAEDEILFPHNIQAGADADFPGQVETPVCLLNEQAPYGLFRVRILAKIDNRHGELPVAAHRLEGLTVTVLYVERAQDFVACHQRGQSMLQRLDIQRSANARGAQVVVEG